jgi:DNA polymerase V
MYALIDCNNFYVSCERVFNPHVRNKPVAVLSNNDGCFVARSNEIKKLGIPMGAPYFKFKDEVEKMGAVIFSSNYELYGDMSRRVMEVLSTFTDTMEIYSIDEAFMSFPNWPDDQMIQLGHTIRSTVGQQVGIPVSVGFAKTKTLAKVAAERAKKDPDNGGVCLLSHPDTIARELDQFDISDIWGIGRKYTKFLNKYGVYTAADFLKLEPEWVRKHMTVMGLRTWQELRGFVCETIQENIPAKKAIASTRSFGRGVYHKSELREAMARYVSRGSAKLRRQNSVAHYLHVFVMTSRFQDNAYYRSTGIRLSQGTNYTPELVAIAHRLLDKVFVPGKKYKKGGILLSGITPADLIQRPLFGEVVDTDKQARIMKAIDTINTQYGRSKITLASTGIDARWTMNSDYRSDRFTTNWDEILKVNT